MGNSVEVWLRGPVPGVPPLLQPAVHALLQVKEEVLPLVLGLSADQLWARPGGAASIGFHLKHIPGSLDRLLTYSSGEQLSREQLEYLGAERSVHEDRPALAELIAGFSEGIDRGIAMIREVPDELLLQLREVGRQKRPSTTLGLIFHAAEHSSRHAGQIITLSRVVRG